MANLIVLANLITVPVSTVGAGKPNIGTTADTGHVVVATGGAQNGITESTGPIGYFAIGEIEANSTVREHVIRINERGTSEAKGFTVIAVTVTSTESGMRAGFVATIKNGIVGYGGVGRLERCHKGKGKKVRKREQENWTVAHSLSIGERVQTARKNTYRTSTL